MTTVLIAGDYEPLRSAIAEGLRARGYAVLEAQDGAEGVRLAQQHHPDLVLLDLRMPVMDGWSAAKALQENPATAPIPRVAITVLRPDRSTLDKLSADFALVLHKPIALRDLSVTIGRLIHGPSMNQPQRLFVNAKTGERYRVRLTPREGKGALGVDWRLNTLVFETPQGRWIGSVPLYYTVQSERLTDSDLAELLHQAVGRR